MKHLLAAVVISILGLPATCVAPALAETSPSGQVEVPPNDKIAIAYVPPTKAELVPLYERLKARKVLESVQRFLAPLILPRDIEVRFDQCDSASLLYKPGEPATICYEYVEQIERMAPKSETVELAQGPVTREQAIVGPVVQAVLHQAALATFDALNIPVWGRPEDAADRVAAYVMLAVRRERSLEHDRRHRLVSRRQRHRTSRFRGRAGNGGPALLHDALHRGRQQVAHLLPGSALRAICSLLLRPSRREVFPPHVSRTVATSTRR